MQPEVRHKIGLATSKTVLIITPDSALASECGWLALQIQARPDEAIVIHTMTGSGG